VSSGITYGRLFFSRFVSNCINLRLNCRMHAKLSPTANSHRAFEFSQLISTYRQNAICDKTTSHNYSSCLLLTPLNDYHSVTLGSQSKHHNVKSAPSGQPKAQNDNLEGVRTSIRWCPSPLQLVLKLPCTLTFSSKRFLKESPGVSLLDKNLIVLPMRDS
jgi:hypothetical protein